MTSEDLGHLEGLRQETLDLAGAGHSQFVLLRQLIHTQNGDDILQGFVVLQQESKQVSLTCFVSPTKNEKYRFQKVTMIKSQT